MVQSDRLAARADRVGGGIGRTRPVARDQVRTGIADLGRGGYGPLERVAARMVDAQAPGVAGMLRSLPGELAGEGWPGQLLEQLGALHLLIQAHRRIDRLPADLAATVRSRVGYPVRKAEVLTGPGRSRTTGTRWARWTAWSSGWRPAGSGCWARPRGAGRCCSACSPRRIPRRLRDSRAAAARSAALLPRLGAVPGAARGAARPPGTDRPPARGDVRRYAGSVGRPAGRRPLGHRMPAVVLAAAIPPSGREGLAAARGRPVVPRRLVELPGEPWPLLARSLGEPITVFGEWGPRGFLPLSLLPEDPGPGCRRCRGVEPRDGPLGGPGDHGAAGYRSATDRRGGRPRPDIDPVDRGA